MQMWTEIRRRAPVEGASKRSVCREYGIGWRTLEKILANTELRGYRTSAARPRAKLGPYLPVIEQILSLPTRSLRGTGRPRPAPRPSSGPTWG